MREILRRAVILRDGARCRYCGYPAHHVVIGGSESRCRWRAYDHIGRAMPFDHVVARCYGGDTSEENIVLSCVRCHTQKSFLLEQDLSGDGREQEALLAQALNRGERPWAPPPGAVWWNRGGGVEPGQRLSPGREDRLRKEVSDMRKEDKVRRPPSMKVRLPPGFYVERGPGCYQLFSVEPYNIFALGGRLHKLRGVFTADSTAEEIEKYAAGIAEGGERHGA